MIRWTIPCLGLVMVWVLGGCASVGRGPIQAERSTCVVVGGLLGGLAGAVVANNAGESETDEELAGGALGAAAGAALGALLCGEPQAPPRAPTARIDARPTSGPAPLEVAFDGSADAPDGAIVSYAWRFGDGASARGPRVGHTYEQPGVYPVELVVTDDSGRTARATAQIRVEENAAEPEAPEPTTRRRIVLRGINFGFDSAEIGPADAPILDIAVEQLQANPDVRVRVVGHTDSVGAESYNQGLSERRAAAVARYLSEQGIARDRLSVVGLGESDPVASNETPDGRAQNRRVALEIVE